MVVYAFLSAKKDNSARPILLMSSFFVNYFGAI